MIVVTEKSMKRFKRLAIFLCLAVFIVSCNSSPASPMTETPVNNSPIKSLDFSTPTKTTQAPPTEQPYHCIFVDNWLEPSGDWMGMPVVCQSPGSPRVEVLGFNRKHWTFEYPQYNPSYTYRLYKWSYEKGSDNKYLYFYSLLTRPWDFDWNSYQPARSLFRMDLSNGDTDIILSEKELLPYNAISLSPDDESIVYLSLNSTKREIGVRNIQTGQENTAAIEGFDDGGNFLWSPGKQRLAFVLSNTGYNKNNHPYPKKETVFILDTDTMALDQVYSVDTDEKTIEPFSWEGENLVVKDIRYKYLILIEVQTGKESRFYPTSTPPP